MPVSTHTTLDDPRANFRTDPTAINDAGTIVGTYVDLTGNHGFLYSGGTYATLDAPGATGTTRASGINASGLIVGDYTTADGSHGFLYSNGGLEVYDFNNNQLTGAAFLGTAGLDWQFAGIAPVSGAGRSDLVLRNVNTGAFEVYNIANNQMTGAASLGQVGLEWQLGGLAAHPPTASAASMGDSSQVTQLVQAMAGFGGSGGAAENLNTAPFGSDTSQQPLLTMPNHT